MEKILIVEDEKKISRFLELELSHEGYKTKKVFNGREAINLLEEDIKKFDLIILDVMLPKLNGMEVLRRLRKFSQIPVIMLTARDQTMDKVMGLDSGADDYMTKPFQIEELLARIRVCLKRKRNKNSKNSQKIYEYGPLTLNENKYQVCFNDNPIELTNKEFSLLKFLLINKEIVLSREKILKKIWGYDYYGDTNIVDVYIRYLRQKIDEKYDRKMIHTIRGVGYTLKNDS
ncbi:MAG: response regulator transcription factor [Bacillota bacterium]